MIRRIIQQPHVELILFYDNYALGETLKTSILAYFLIKGNSKNIFPPISVSNLARKQVVNEINAKRTIKKLANIYHELEN